MQFYIRVRTDFFRMYWMFLFGIFTDLLNVVHCQLHRKLRTFFVVNNDAFGNWIKWNLETVKCKHLLRVFFKYMFFLMTSLLNVSLVYAAFVHRLAPAPCLTVSPFLQNFTDPHIIDTSISIWDHNPYTCFNLYKSTVRTSPQGSC